MSSGFVDVGKLQVANLAFNDEARLAGLLSSRRDRCSEILFSIGARKRGQVSGRCRRFWNSTGRWEAGG